MNKANKNRGLTESQDMELATVKVSITPETQKRKKSQKSDLGDIEKVFWQDMGYGGYGSIIYFS
ncbi:MAG: hypothetical protein MGF17_06130 [Trichodesmium sp. MAG_R04]|nr:hypothetical protein [Trichodesmium sp. MAG_R04]